GEGGSRPPRREGDGDSRPPRRPSGTGGARKPGGFRRDNINRDGRSQRPPHRPQSDSTPSGKKRDDDLE
ncbi:MAG TPA: hypothetical protein PLZ51_19435, partial [Aggregatilineales bacterium]|nr:hypothetical protein [Aggregatilineales bacterium]